MKVAAIDRLTIAKKPVKSVVTFNSKEKNIEKYDFNENKKRIYSIAIPLFLASAITSAIALVIKQKMI